MTYVSKTLARMCVGKAPLDDAGARVHEQEGPRAVRRLGLPGL